MLSPLLSSYKRVSSLGSVLLITALGCSSNLNTVFADLPESLTITDAPAALCPAALPLERKTQKIAERCVATTLGIFDQRANGNHHGIAVGSGVLVSEDGLVLTAAHVLDTPGAKFFMRLIDGRVVQAVALGMDRGTDAAMARILDPAPPGGWPHVEIAPADSAKIGEWVLATGNSGGIVIGRNPPIRLGRVTIHEKGKIQSDCTVVSGDSGGPLFDLEGRVVGIHSNISVSTDENHHVPISMFRAEWDNLLASKVVQSKGGMLAERKSSAGGSGKPKKSGDPEFKNTNLAKALNRLATAGDNEAKELLERGKHNGMLALDREKLKDILRRAEALDTSKESDPNAANESVAGAVAEEAIDPLRIQEALQKLLSEGDEEVKRLMENAISNDSKLSIEGEQAATLIRRAKLAAKPAAKSEKMPSVEEEEEQTEQNKGKDEEWKPLTPPMRKGVAKGVRESILKQHPNANLTDKILERILDKARYNPSEGSISLHPDLEDLLAMGVSASDLPSSPITTRVSQRLGKTSLQALSIFAPALDAAGDCIVEIMSDEKPILMGTVVDADGWIVTKASDLTGKISVVLGNGKRLDAQVVGKDEATDIALLKVKAKGLKAAEFCDTATLGKWLISPVRDPNRPAVGVASVAERPIPEKFTHFYGEQKIMLGVSPANANTTPPVIGTVQKGLAAEKAGLKEGDEVLSIDGTELKDWKDLVSRVRSANPGDTLTFKVRREEEELELPVLLGEAKVAAQTADKVGETDKLAVGKLSKRRTKFPSAIQHDAVVWGDQCGGPLVNLEGRVVGVNIARYDRVCTFAIPGKLVQETVDKLRTAARGKAAEKSSEDSPHTF